MSSEKYTTILIEKGKQVLFISCYQLVQDLLIARKELGLTKKLKKLSRFDAVIVDDIGYVQQSRKEMEVLFTFLADRYEQRSLMITSNLPFSKWESIFKAPMTTATAIDRLVHQSIILELNLNSYRMEEAKKVANNMYPPPIAQEFQSPCGATEILEQSGE